MSHLTDEQRKYLQTNFNSILEKQTYTIDKIIKDNDDNALSNAPKAPSRATLYKMQRGEDVSKGTVCKFVDYYNYKFSPKVTFKSITSEKLATDTMTKNKLNIDTRIEGTYKCFYLSDNEKDRVHGGYLFIYSFQGQQKCRLILGINDWNLFDNKQILSNEIFNKDTESGAALNAFNHTRNQFPSLSRDSCYYSEGDVKLTDKALILETRNGNNPNHFTYLSIVYNPYYLKTQPFVGGLGAYFSPSVADLNLRLCKIGIIRYDASNYESKALSNIKLTKLLKMEISFFHRFDLSADEVKNWKNFITYK